MLNDPIAYADQLLAASVVDPDGTLNLPVDLEKVAGPLGIEVFAREDLTADQSPQIGVADNNPNAVAIFVSAHEPHRDQTPKIGGALAALLLMPDDQTKTIEQRLSLPVSDEQIAWSRAFIGELLVPAGTLLDPWNATFPEMDTPADAVHAVAVSYAVSDAFMADRLTTLGLLRPPAAPQDDVQA
ncbi:MAG: hypothetical protein L0L50_04000 [Propionibacterium sp.]|nr:hypothetical protein [Propionibacterium sp.]